MKVYIVRHGQTNSNLMNSHALESNDLTNIGIKQAEDLREKIKNINFDIIISSPLVRTRHTTEIINVKNSKIIFDNRIKERNPGNLSGKSRKSENREEYWNYFNSIKYGTSENIQDFFSRIYDFLDELKTKNYEKVLIVAHGGVSKAFSGYFEGIKDGKFLNRGLKNCEIKEYEL